jgi:hypothetical protein
MLMRRSWPRLILAIAVIVCLAIVAGRWNSVAAEDSGAMRTQRKTPEKKAPEKKEPPAELPMFEIVPDDESPDDEKKPEAKPKPEKKPEAKPKPKGDPKAKPGKKPAAPAIPPGLGPDPLLPEGTCHVCLGTGFVPLSSRVPYVHLEGSRHPGAAACVPWQFCPQCQTDREIAELVEAEATRLQTAGATHLEWEKRMGMKLALVEARHLTLHCEMSADKARKQGEAAEETIAYIQKKTRGVFLTPTRCNTFEYLFLWDKPSYLKSIEVCKNIDEFKGNEDWHLFKDVIGYGGQLTKVGNANAGKQYPPEHMIVSATAARQISTATGGKIGDCLGYGFAYHCEHAVKGKILISYVRYTLNDAKFSPDWPAEAKKLYAERKFPTWESLFASDLRDWSPAQHVGAFTVTTFLMQDPVKFAKMAFLVQNGSSPTAAVEKMYGKTIDELQQLCGRWATR